MKSLVQITKSVAVIIVGIFVFKLISGFVAGKFPNSVTNAVNTVIQTA